MTVAEFREKSDDGGFDTYHLTDEEMFLTPEAWESVGNIEGWKKGFIVMYEYDGVDDKPVFIQKTNMPVYRLHMYRMIDTLFEGKTIVDYISTL